MGEAESDAVIMEISPSKDDVLNQLVGATNG